MSRLPAERQKILFKTICAFSLLVLSFVLQLHNHFCRPYHDSTEFAMDTEMVPSHSLRAPFTNNHTAYNRDDAQASSKEKGDDITREHVMRVMEKMYNGNLINRNYFVFLLRNAKTMLQSLETVYDVPLEKSSHEGTKVTVRNLNRCSLLPFLSPDKTLKRSML